MLELDQLKDATLTITTKSLENADMSVINTLFHTDISLLTSLANTKFRALEASLPDEVFISMVTHGLDIYFGKNGVFFAKYDIKNNKLYHFHHGETVTKILDVIHKTLDSKCESEKV